MSRLLDGLSRATIQQTPLSAVPRGMVTDGMGLPNPPTVDVRGDGGAISESHRPRATETQEAVGLENARLAKVDSPPASRLVAWNEPNSLGAEKFRALAVRLSEIRSQYNVGSMQVTSSVINEGKTFVSANLAVTLGKYSGAKTLLVEGDLHRPRLASMFGLRDGQGLGEWWSGKDQDISRYLVRFNDSALWFLPAGKLCDRPSDILHSARFEQAFAQLSARFDWTIVDSTPMLPVIDANLWSRLVDGTLLVVREGVAPLKALKQGLQSLDRPKLIGVVVNEASDFNQVDYDGQYYAG